ncbi:MAG: hypothetical protein H7Y09_09460 [Chitinophagaceae bacterium]|nr:hypothetical protein [Anaerolineae bacterium]
MSIKLYWVDEKQTILRYDVRGRWTWWDFYEAFGRAYRMSATVQHRVDMMVNLADSGPFPGGALNHAQTLSNRLSENMGLTIVVTGNRLAKALYQSGCGLYPNVPAFLRLANSVEEARALIEAERNQEDA